ncbi:glutamine synthetase type III [Muricaecibacterium torontonense]|jgi:glutamine synthetase|uniref:Glutamine synthetase type III n=1 Tax=Muricaecibacterium torontonense TaxID=3032871 RepID=A0A4S2F045_9ACTN|nr:glutamine synthetase III [Muricaecibacterium torontonense]TGY62206.1 glutamine synthetase type III [Muricaecibacterium torontonense]
MASKVSQEYGTLVFNDAVMRERLPRPTYKELEKVIKEGRRLDLDIANEVAHAMKEWALEQGATHYAHWFQPLTGITSEKHDSFLAPQKDGTALMTFSGKELVQGEPDASSFPNGGLRATFEARGYTAWDPTSPAFIKDEVLCIPTAFIAYTGEALDKKTPFLRSTVALNDQAKRVLALFGKRPKSVECTVGPEQEYFLIQENDFASRPDLIMCGRTLFGCEPVKGQELEEHYFGAIRPTVNEYMKELDDELWKLGIPATTKHNEVAPCQHELAPVFERASMAIDHNLLTMEKMKVIASHHGLTCLQHEKPFDYVNGSGKHDNWSIAADGKNLLDPSDTPEENLQFLVFLTAVIAAVDKHQDLMRCSVASAGNDHRLGANEAPPAIISIFLGDDLAGVVNALINGESYTSHGHEIFDVGVPQLADVVLDTTDRNRTSPFAFTGNKFEFRMCGSQQNLSDPNMVLNTAVAEMLDEFATLMEQVPEEEFASSALAWIKDTLTAHQRIIFNGNGYSEEWPKEAEKRGLLNLRTTADALPAITKPENLAFFSKYGVLDEAESTARYVAKAEQYAKLLNIEANTMVYMVRHYYLPALYDYSGDLAQTVATKEAIGIQSPAERGLLAELTDGITLITQLADSLEVKNKEAQAIEDPGLLDDAYRDVVIPAMEALRAPVDAMEQVVGHEYWPFPSYNRMLFYV